MTFEVAATTRYEYPETDEQQAARSLLEAAGYSVSKPQCPDCKGWGAVNRFASWQFGGVGGTEASSERCPRGCAYPMMVL